MGDAQEVMEHILETIHTVGTDAGDENCNPPCLSHSTFGLDLVERVVSGCKCKTPPPPSTSTRYFHLVLAADIQNVVRTHVGARPRFGQTLFEILAADCRPCPGGCGPAVPHHLSLQSPPPVFAINIVWDSLQPSKGDIAVVVDALDTVLTLSDVFPMQGAASFSLTSMVCFYGQHYTTLAWHEAAGMWVLFDDNRTSAVGLWGNVVDKMMKGSMLPFCLFFQKNH
mmetsp:Transcript_22021/g.47910  ORF Transcript_22021/g.47910 Transcript_22021/m.47910 type:complete len:226 (+) Transcript_22021:23-700(+)